MTAEADLALLRRFEPVICYTKGEQFFPMDVARYVRLCSYWVQRPNRTPLRIWPEGELTLDRLGQPRVHGQGAVNYLKFIEPLNLTEMAALRLRHGLLGQEDEFRAGRGRLARVGYASRLVDALFSLSLLARGRVPGATAVAAARAYQEMIVEREMYKYYGRVARQNGWVGLQYWFFYAYNNWRSGFFGANDHESDWEMIYIYLYQDEGELHPEWVAYAAHDFSGDDLRRHWDDDEVEKVGEHPVIYAGAGSHASYFQKGEYLAELEIPLVTPLIRLADQLQKGWDWAARPYREDEDERAKWSDFSIFRVPFVDYARGDGLVIGPGQAKTWAEPSLIDPPPPWVKDYRGLWGWYARDPFSGENAPAGPMYNRDGTVRRSWYDPLGWAGLEKVPPPPQRQTFITLRQAQIEARREELAQLIELKSEELQGLGIELRAVSELPHLKQVKRTHEERLQAAAAELDELRAQMAEDAAVSQALGRYAGRIRRGMRGPLRVHIRRAHEPASDEGKRINAFAEVWAALSIGLFMIGFVTLALFAREYLVFGLISLISLIVFIEASFRRRLTRVITSVTIALAVVAALALLFEFFWELVTVGVLAAGSYIMWENLRELRG